MRSISISSGPLTVSCISSKRASLVASVIAPLSLWYGHLAGQVTTYMPCQGMQIGADDEDVVAGNTRQGENMFKAAGVLCDVFTALELQDCVSSVVHHRYVAVAVSRERAQALYALRLILILLPPVSALLCSNTAVQAGGGGCCCGLMVKVVCLLDQLDLLKPAIYSAGSLCLAEERNVFRQLSGVNDLSCSLRNQREAHPQHGGNRVWSSK
ncbi:hypothetical protein GQ54DRAFT_86913 [Martensiomyces pterosporus]|nr:hypothetical protein GQ54DRAFT_86913 [Martensiomyces pterosporus]